ncbi:MAG TPA: DsbA family protein [Dongiaceae bacterium]|nr:DsbA family protein [Dongiaceae bacterium]
MRKSFAVAILCAAVAIGIAADRLYYRNGGNDLVVPANAANQSSSDNGISTPGIVLADGQRLDAQTMGPIIEQYMLDHPELLTRVVAKLQQKEAAAAKAETKIILASAKEELLNDPAAPVLGNPHGDVTVVEFFDYKCPYCKRVADDLNRLIVDDPKIRVVFKEFPILGPDSQIAALGGLAANRQGKYGAYHQAAMEHRGPFSEDVVTTIAKDIGLDMDRFKADLADTTLLDAIKKNQALADKLSIDGTPAFIIGQEKVPGAIDYDSMKKLVDEARKSGS